MYFFIYLLFCLQIPVHLSALLIADKIRTEHIGFCK